MKNLFWLALLLTACSPTLPRGRFDSEMPEWMQGEGPSTSYYFGRHHRFKMVTIFCFPYEHGEGRYRVVGDSLRLRFGSRDPWNFPERLIRDTTLALPLKVLNDSTLEINGEEFFRTKTH